MSSSLFIQIKSTSFVSDGGGVLTLILIKNSDFIEECHFNIVVSVLLPKATLIVYWHG